MRELEKILEEIEQRVNYYKEHAMLDYVDICVGLREAEDIIRKHMNGANYPYITSENIESISPASEEYLQDCKKVAEKYKRDNDGWIPVEDALPEGKALACDKYGEMMIGYICGNANGGYDCEGDGYEMFNVLAWRPLPEPYRPERSDNHDGE